MLSFIFYILDCINWFFFFFFLVEIVQYESIKNLFSAICFIKLLCYLGFKSIGNKINHHHLDHHHHHHKLLFIISFELKFYHHHHIQVNTGSKYLWSNLKRRIQRWIFADPWAKQLIWQNSLDSWLAGTTKLCNQSKWNKQKIAIY